MGSGSRGSTSDDASVRAGRFVVERCLGEGSMGAVYLAYDRVRGAHVALKTLRRVDASGIYRFKREFRALADVSHPNLVELHELFSEDSEWFFTMEYVQGQDFLGYVLGESRRTAEISPRRTRQIRGGPAARTPGMEVLFPTPLRSFDRVRDVLKQVVSAIIALHNAGKLHRDLKPDNVMVTREGRAVVLDFGITAERSGPDAHGTLEAGVMGTPAYMSPEQAGGAPVHEATDWYALGAMLYEALTGEVPFDGSYTEVLKQKQEIDPPAPSAVVSGVPDDLNVLCVRLLARDPEERPNGREILEALGSSDSHVRTITTLTESRPPFLGRSHEIGELERALAATDSGTPVVAFVQGMTGMGKTALVERFLESAVARGAVVLAGRCYEYESVPFNALDSVVDSLSRYLGRIPPQEAAEVVPRDVHALSQLFPVLQRADTVRTARRRVPLVNDPRALRTTAIIALKEMLARIAMRQPLVMFIDDLQWGDVDSARVLADLTSGSDRPAMLLVCTFRSTDRERSPCLSKLLPLMRERRQVQVRDIQLAALSDRESFELSERLLGGMAAEQAIAIAREARGSPYLVGQLVEHVRSEAGFSPEAVSAEISLDRALSERLDALSREARTVLELLAVSGRPLRERIMARLAEGELNLATALTELRRAKLVRGVGATEERAVAMYHDSIREAVLARMNRAFTQKLHAQLAAATEACEPIDFEALIHHLLGAQDVSRAGIYAIGAARQAMEGLAFDKAAELFEIAVQYHEDEAWRQELLAQWAEALVSAGRSTRAAEIYLRAAERAPLGEASELRRKAGTQLLLAGRWHRGVEVLAPALADLGIAFPRTIDEGMKQWAELWPALQKRGFDFVPKSEIDLAPATRARLDALWNVVQATFAADPLVCQMFVLRHLHEALDAGEKTRITLGLCAYFILVDLALATSNDFKPESLQRAEALCRDLTDPRCHAWTALARAFAYQNEGLLKPAILDFEQAEDLLRNRCRDGSAELRTCRMLCARALAMTGDLDGLGRCEAWIREASECDDLIAVTRLRLIAMPRVLAENDLEQARRALQLSPELRAESIDLTRALFYSGSISLALYTDDGDALLRLAGTLESIAKSPLLRIRLWKSDYLLMRLRLTLAASRFAPDTEESMLNSAEEMLGELERLGMECHADHARILRAMLELRRGQKAEALAGIEAILSDADMGGESGIIRACARLYKGRLVGGDAGAALWQEGVRELASRGVKEPERFARMYAPGIE